VEPDVPDKPDDTPAPTPAPKPVKHHDISLTLVERTAPKKHVHDTTAEDEAAAEAKAERAEARRRALAFDRVTHSLDSNLSGSTDVSVPGPGSQSYANYGQIVKSIYENAWNPPDSADNDEASPKVRVVISRDGSVISAHIIEPSGDKALDESVQRTLDRVTFIRPFPDGATENERSYIINFNLKAKRMLG
jgi:TonB family protein